MRSRPKRETDYRADMERRTDADDYADQEYQIDPDYRNNPEYADMIITPLPSAYSGVEPEPRTREELFSRYQEILDECRRTGEAVHITRDGEDELIVMSPKAYRRFRLAELTALLDDADMQEKQGLFSPAEEAYARLKEAMDNGTL